MIAVPLYNVVYAAGLLPHGAPLDSLDPALGFGVGVALLGVLVTAFCGIPAVNWLSEHRLLSRRHVLAAGALLGNVPFLVVAVLILAVQTARGTAAEGVGQYWYGFAGAVVRIGIGTVVGMGSAAILWFVAIEGNVHWDAPAVPVHRRTLKPPDRAGGVG